MKKHILASVLLGGLLQASHATVLVNFEFNGAANANLTAALNTGSLVGATTGWAQNVTGVVQNGSGQLVAAAGPTPTSPATNFSIPQTVLLANTGIYDLVVRGLTFSTPSAGDSFYIGFRTSATGTALPNSSSRERFWARVGEFSGGAGLDVTGGPVQAPSVNVSDVVTNLSTPLDLVLRLDTDAATGTILLDSGSGLTQIGSNFTVTLGTGNSAVHTLSIHFVSVNGPISIDQIQLVAIPEPSTYAVISGLRSLALSPCAVAAPDTPDCGLSSPLTSRAAMAAPSGSTGSRALRVTAFPYPKS
jgi:hypothetical protein